MGRTEDWAWLCEDGEEPETVSPQVTRGQAFWGGFALGIVLAVAALIVGWAVSA